MTATRVVDLRSDTVTLPTEKMRVAMQRAEVGDAQKGEDASVNRLEAMAAARLGKEAAVFLPSGTMSNLVAVMSHCQRGDRVVVGQISHVYSLEADGMTSVAGVMPVTVPDFDGVPDPRAVEAAIFPRTSGRPHTSLILLENTHNRACGAVVTPAEIGAVAEVARRYDVPIHVDGARIFNAAVALKVDVKDLVREVDSVCFCLSKGLCAPVGSILAGSAEFIKRARFWQKVLGGAMRQAGHMAAAGIVALEEMVDRLEEDHQNARYLAEMLAGLPVVKVNPARVESNIIVFDVDHERMSNAEFVQAVAARGVLVSTSGKDRLRMVTHHGIGREEVEFAARAIKEAVSAA
ncbi:MAG: GntG family PLP-dependent aldolase [Sphingomonadaceae bacterium]